MFGEFEVWKLHSIQEYFFFFLMVGSFAFITWFIIRRINSARNDKSAARRVGKKLKVKSGAGKIYTDVTFDFGGQKVSYSLLLVDAAGIVAVKSVGRGLKIYGTNDDSHWKVVDNKLQAVRIPNPIKELETGFDPLRKYLSKSGVYRVNIEALTVFADPFDTPELYLGRDSGCIVFPELKKWVENRMLRAANINDKIDHTAVTAALDKAIVKEPQ